MEQCAKTSQEQGENFGNVEVTIGVDSKGDVDYAIVPIWSSTGSSAYSFDTREQSFNKTSEEIEKVLRSWREQSLLEPWPVGEWIAEAQTQIDKFNHETRFPWAYWSVVVKSEQSLGKRIPKGKCYQTATERATVGGETTHSPETSDIEVDKSEGEQ